MRSIIKIYLLLSLVNFTVEYDVCLQNQTDLQEFKSTSQNIHRIKRRSLNFPTGSAFVVSLTYILSPLIKISQTLKISYVIIFAVCRLKVYISIENFLYQF